MSRSLWLLASLVVSSACAQPPGPFSPPASWHSAAPPVRFLDAPPWIVLDSREYPHFVDLPSARDPLELYASRLQAPSARFRPIAGHVERFPGARVTTARAVVFADRAGLFDRETAGCRAHSERRAIAQDGTYCPSVRVASRALAYEQIGRLLTALNEPDEKVLFRSAFEPAWAVVFFGKTGAPLAELDVSADCELWQTRPSARHGLDAPSAATATLRALCQELGLPSCAPAEQDKLAAARLRQERDWLLAAVPANERWRLRPPLALPADKTLAMLSRDERRLACAWHIANLGYVAVWQPVLLEPGAGFECADGRYFTVLGMRECERSFPSCAPSVARAEACERSQYADPCAVSPLGAACAPVRECLWGLARRDQQH